MSPEIRETPIGGSLRDFLGVVDYIYRDDPNYVRPLDRELRQRLSRKNPFFAHAEGVMLTAHRNGYCVGRCTAQVDREHLAKYRDDVGFFGFFDTIDDEEVAQTLLAAAGRWLEQRGMKRMRGPISLSTHEAIGCLVEGFDTPPMVMMPHHLSYQGGLIERAGLSKLKDAYAWRYSVLNIPVRAQRAHDEVEAMSEVRSRHADRRTLDSDIRVIMDVYNDARSENWGHVPLTDAELAQRVKDIKRLSDPELMLITEIDGYPAAVALALPNVHEVGGSGGKLLPASLPRLLRRFRSQRPKTARLLPVAIRKRFRSMKKYAPLSAYLYTEMHRAAAHRGLEWRELSWTLEDSGPINSGIRLMGGTIYKRYRIYERELSA
jgi:hypothetical protein